MGASTVELVSTVRRPGHPVSLQTLLASRFGPEPRPTDTTRMGIGGEHLRYGNQDRRRRFWRRAVVVLSVLVAITAGLLAFLLATQDEEADPQLGPIAAAASELRRRAVDVNAAWDDQEAVVGETERQVLYDDTELQLEALVADTRDLAVQVEEAVASLSGADRDALDSATADMVRGAEEMLAGPSSARPHQQTAAIGRTRPVCVRGRRGPRGHGSGILNALLVAPRSPASFTASPR